MKRIQNIINFLIHHQLVLTTAESCTAGEIIHLLSKHERCGDCIDTGFVVYSSAAKKRLLGVQEATISKYTLTSEPIAKEMVIGALKVSTANVAVAATGIAGNRPMDGIEPGTVCFSWGFKNNSGNLFLSSKTRRFEGEKDKIQYLAAKFAILSIPTIYNELSLKENFP